MELLRPIAEQRPDDAGALYRLGDALYQLERVAEALPLLERAAQIDGNNAEYQYKSGNALKDLERPQEALERYRRALQLEPRHARALNNSGTILEMRGMTEEALHHYRRAVQADAELLPACRNLASLLLRSRRYAEAIDAYRALLGVNSASPQDWLDLGDACQELEHHEEAVRSYGRALELDSGSVDAHLRSAISLQQLGKFDEAEAAARRALDLAPEHGRAQVCLGDILLAQGRLNKAIAAYEHVLARHPDLPEVLNNLASARQYKGELDEAERLYRRAIELAPEFVTARINVAGLMNGVGRWADAAAEVRAALDVEPAHVEAARQLLMLQLYAPGSARQLAESHLEFGRRFGSGTGASPVWSRPVRADSRIRVGYVSSDFRVHPVGHVLAPIIRSHDREAFEVYLYSNVQRPDHLTEWFSNQATVWRSIVNLPDAPAADLIRRDEIDILVLLAGRFDNNRPLLALQRAAPIQVSMHDPATSGLSEMDYLIADRNLVPRHAVEPFTERVVCLPTFYLHSGMRAVDPVSEPPSARSGWITFGSFNNPAKVNEDVVALWARVLDSVPGSKLLLKYKRVFATPSVRSRLVGLFRGHGIGEERLIIPELRIEELEAHLAHYQDMDIALDTFPFSGSTTTFEALWMGVPVVTLQEERMVGRWSAAMLRKVGLARLIAETKADFVEIARALAADRAQLARLRTVLRDRVARSPLCAGEARARQLERLYRRMWARWLSQQS